MGMYALVTGGAGFIGSHLVEQLLDEGHDVTVIDNLSSGSREYVPGDATFIEGDITDAAVLEQNMHGDIDVVFHLAANPDVRSGAENPSLDVNENILGTHNVLEAMRKNDVDEVVFTSSSTVYGEADEFPTPEDYGPLEPISMYGASKLSGESLISAYVGTFGFTASVFRLANIIGPRNHKGVIYDFIRKLQDDPEQLDVLGNGLQRKSYLHVDDCVDAILTGVDATEDGCAFFNVGSADTVEVRTIAEIVSGHFDNPDIVYEDQEKGWDGDVTEMLLDIEKLQGHGWSPSMSSEDAVRQTTEQLIDTLG